MIAIIIGIDHGYYAIKTRQVSFPSGIIGYDYEPYTMQNVLQYQGKYYVCGTGRQTLVKNKTSNDNYYLLMLAAIAEEINVTASPDERSSADTPTASSITTPSTTHNGLLAP